MDSVASWVLVIWYIIGSLILIGATVAMAIVLNKVNARLEAITAKVEPLLTKADQLLVTVNEKVGTIGDKTDAILDQGNAVAENVHEKVDKTATAVQRTIHAPLISINSLAAGVSRSVETFTRLQREERPTRLANVTASGNGSSDNSLAVVDTIKNTETNRVSAGADINHNEPAAVLAGRN